MRHLLAITLLCFIANAQQAYELEGDIWGAHDPSIIKQGNTWYVFTTGKAPGRGQIPIRCSNDLTNWKFCGQVFDTIPDWIHKDSPQTHDLWAPDISFYDGEYRLYYAYSRFGKNTSGIALATNKTLDRSSPDYKWVDRGLVVKSMASDNFNAIDPNFVVDLSGRSWLAFGSFWSGIHLRRLNSEGLLLREDQGYYSIASRRNAHDEWVANPGPPADWQAIEAPFIVHHGEYYYLFVSWDLCCRGTKSTYRIVAGRAHEIKGAYLDENGTIMTHGGGTEILEGNSDWVGPGGQSVLMGSPEDLMVFHAYDSHTGKPALQISTIDWSHDWPRVALRSH